MCQAACNGCIECDPGLAKLEQLFGSAVAAVEKSEAVDAAEVVEADPAERLEEVSKILRDTAILLEFLSTPDFCKAITKKERLIIDKQVDKVWAGASEIDQVIDQLSDDEEE